ncbi:golvesin C-terminal-like domain-containing protein [Catenulispora rubra]|uniref:golvesin C-terminal-like domain-containing protein n=1 Tax=Catenulispora rubra TaxID=280293 RepID=UPI0018927040|nr:CHAP domain-containing protein [Catenulispora rubra]
MGKLAHIGRVLAGLLILVATIATVGTPGSAQAAAGPSPGFVVGRAQHLGNDYPWETLGQFEHQDQGADPWNEYYGQCDSFAAWKAYENLNGSGAGPKTAPKPAPKPAAYPAPNWSPANAAVSNVDQNTWGNAGDWVTSARAHGWVVDAVATPGSIPIWDNGHLGPVGHVGYVDDVYADGSITVENYNLHANGEYSKFHLPRGGGPETSFGATYQIPWPDGFAHLADGPARAADGTVLPPELPVPSTTEYGYAYSPDVTLVGPGSPASQFSTTGSWPTRPGHGELANMRYTPTSGSVTATATTTATWRPTGLVPNTCYRIDAFVPDNYSDDPAASYTVSGLSGTAAASVDENAFTNDWAELGVYRATAAGGLTVHLDNRGATGLYVAADAVRFWPQPTC